MMPEKVLLIGTASKHTCRVCVEEAEKYKDWTRVAMPDGSPHIFIVQALPSPENPALAELIALCDKERPIAPRKLTGRVAVFLTPTLVVTESMRQGGAVEQAEQSEADTVGAALLKMSQEWGL
jgi:hypothetical protein